MQMNDIQNDLPPNNKTDLELGRLDSFTKEWPFPDDGPFSRLIMARAGYFYRGNKDSVQCFCCRVKLNQWQPGIDDPWELHSDKCLFGQKKKREGQLTLEELIDVFENKWINFINKKMDDVAELLKE